MHIAAALSGDKTMIDTLMAACPEPPCNHQPKCGDLHGVYQYKLLETTGTLFERAGIVKVANFGCLYRGGPGMLTAIVAKGRVYITDEMARLLVEGHRATFPGYYDWGDGEIERVRRRGYAETLNGRRRDLQYEVTSRDPEKRAHAERVAVNHPIQGTAADIAKIAMKGAVEICNDYGAHLSLQVHDELDGWIPQSADTAQFMRDMEHMLTNIELPRGVKLKVEGGIGHSWAETH